MVKSGRWAKWASWIRHCIQSPKTVFPRRWQDDIFFLIVLVSACDICLLLQPLQMEETHIPLIFLLAILIIASYTEGYLYGLLASVLSPLCVNYCFLYPYFELSFKSATAHLTFGILFLVGVLTSIMTTRAKGQEKIRIQSHRAQLRANLLRAVGHDLRTPLTSIVGSADMLLTQEGSVGEGRRRELLENISHESAWLTRLVESLLFATQFSGDPAELRRKPAAVEELVGEAIQTFHKQYSDIEITATVPDELVMVEVDATMIEQVLFNLMQNAILHGDATQINIAVTKKKQNIICFIENNGAKFTRDQLEHLFEEFVHQRTRQHDWDRRRSLGIGLSVCRAIIQAHGGNIGAENTEQGAAVWISLPERGVTP